MAKRSKIVRNDRADCAFGVSRVRLRELAHAGYLPGVRKSSW
jgi:ribosomal protein S14